MAAYGWVAERSAMNSTEPDLERAGLLVAAGTEWFPAEATGAFLASTTRAIGRPTSRRRLACSANR
jgi:hypothetical protein